MSRQKRLETRYGWIEASLRYIGRFDKTSYGNVFDIRSPQISADQAGFVEAFNARLPGSLAPLRIEKGKVVIRSDLPREPVYHIPDPREWIAQVTSIPIVDVTLFTRIDPDPRILKPILEAIASRTPILITCVAGTEPELSPAVSPHSILDTGRHLLVRGYDHDAAFFTDINLARVIRVAATDANLEWMSSDLDRDWIETEDVDMADTLSGGIRQVPIPRALSSHVRSTIAKDKDTLF